MQETMSDRVVRRLKAADPRIRKKRFRANIVRAVVSECPEESEWTQELFDDLCYGRKCNIVPDAWIMDEHARSIGIFEVEDTNPISKDKMEKIISWHWALNSIGWKLNLCVVDRWGAGYHFPDLVMITKMVDGPMPRELHDAISIALQRPPPTR